MPLISLQYSPRKWQTEALSRWLASNQGVVSVVTGGGKTYFAGYCMQQLLASHQDLRFFIVVPTIALLDQWTVSLIDDMAVEPSSIQHFGAGSKSNKPKLINVLVINTARSMLEKLSKGQKSVLIVDECHRAGSEENSKALLGDYFATLGLSATPHREFDAGFEQYIEPALGPVVYEYDYAQALTDKVISEFSLQNVRVSLTPPEKEKYDRYTRSVGRLLRSGSSIENSERLKIFLRRRASVSAQAAMRIPVAVKIAESRKQSRMIVFHERIDSAQAIHELLRKVGVRSTLYHSKLSKSHRIDNLRSFKAGIHSCLVTCRALDEGLNVPDVEIGIIASSTSSIRQRIQRVGRVLRPSQNKEQSVVYTLYATDAEEGRLREEQSRLSGIADSTWVNAEVSS